MSRLGSRAAYRLSIVTAVLAVYALGVGAWLAHGVARERKVTR